MEVKYIYSQEVITYYDDEDYYEEVIETPIFNENELKMRKKHIKEIENSNKNNI